MRTVLLLGVALHGALVGASELPDCSDVENRSTTTHGILLSEVLSVNLESPSEDASIRFDNGDYRLLAYGTYEGWTVPHFELFEGKEICRYGIKPFPIFDSFESSEHAALVAHVKRYIDAYNAHMAALIRKAVVVCKDLSAPACIEVLRLPEN